MLVVNRLIRFVFCLLCVGGSLVIADPAVNHNSSRSNKGTVAGDVSETDLKISNEKVVRKKPGRQSSSDMTPDSELVQRSSGTVKFFNSSKGFGVSASDQDGAGDLTDTDSNISNDMMVRQKPGRQSSNDMTPDSELAQRSSGTVKFFNNSKGFGISTADQDGAGTQWNKDPIHGIDVIFEKDLALENSVVMLYYQLLLEGASDSEAIEYGLIAPLVAADDSDAIEYGLIAALLSNVTVSNVTENRIGDADDIIVRKKPGRAAEIADLGGGPGNHILGMLRNNDPIPGIDVIVEKDSEDDPAMDDSLVVMLNEMLNAGYSKAEVVNFALATGLIGY